MGAGVGGRYGYDVCLSFAMCVHQDERLTEQEKVRADLPHHCSCAKYSDPAWGNGCYLSQITNYL